MLRKQHRPLGHLRQQTCRGVPIALQQSLEHGWVHVISAVPIERHEREIGLFDRARKLGPVGDLVVRVDPQVLQRVVDAQHLTNVRQAFVGDLIVCLRGERARESESARARDVNQK